MKKFLSKEFIEKYEGVNPFPTEIGEFTYTRTYSPYMKDKKRRETWLETCERVVEYSCNLGLSTVEEAEKLFDNMFYLRQFPSGRTLWVGGRPVSLKYPMANYNCSFSVIDDIKAISKLFYLALVGCGIGFRVLKSDAEKLQRFRQDVVVEVDDLNPVEVKLMRQEYTGLDINFNEAKIIVGDSKDGWVKAIDLFLELLTSPHYKKITNIILDVNNVRPRGERLTEFGGFASGPEALINFVLKFNNIIRANKNGGKLEPIEVIDGMNLLGESVVAGGVRRIAEIGLIDHDDTSSIDMKSKLYTQKDGNWVLDKDISHRQLSNNSIFYYEKPSRDKWKWHMNRMRFSGEPGVVNAEAASKRRPNFEGVNPCSEILLNKYGLCNLTEVNVMGFVKNGELRLLELLEAQRLSARMGLRMTLPELEIHEFDVVNKHERLIGCSLTGWQDMVEVTNMSEKDQVNLLKRLKDVAREEADCYAQELGINSPLLGTTIKPSGTLSLLPTVSSGIHRNHSEYYIRRIRVNADDPLAKTVMELGYQWHPEVGQDMDNLRTIVVDFPVKGVKNNIKANVSAIQQLKDYLMFMDNYVEHNVSITVHVREHEWEEVEQFVWDHWDKFIAVSFLPYDDSFYQLLPYEECSEEEYLDLKAKTPKFNPSVLERYDLGEEFGVDESSCEGGVCPVK